MDRNRDGFVPAFDILPYLPGSRIFGASGADLNPFYQGIRSILEMRQDRRETEPVCEPLLCYHGCRWPSLYILLLPCSNTIILGDAICELIDSGVYMHGARRSGHSFLLLCY